jgi:vancomycin resistance protein YoaR
MRKLLLTTALLTSVLLPNGVRAADDPLTSIRLNTLFNTWKVNLEKADWLQPQTQLSWNGFDVRLPESLPIATEEKTLSYLSPSSSTDIDFNAIRSYLSTVVAPEINRDPQGVTISQDEAGKIQFEGFAFNGQTLDYEQTYHLIHKAIQDRIEDIRLPLKIIPAEVKVLSDDLRQKGITGLIATGETNFKNSPTNRRKNIKVGLASFNGQLIPPSEETGAGKILGRVDGSTGYFKELVIRGDQTIPEYGGGLCQVSTTVYRSVLLAGLPILERTNHSYAVSYYDPQGLDATIYPPNPDMRFKNDTLNHILLQTTTVGDKAFSNVYGTPVDRQVDLIGPYYYDYTGTPPPRTEYSTKLAPGEKQLLGAAHGGFKADWYRRITYADPTKPEVIERIHSNYEARPLYTVIGIDPAKPPLDITPDRIDKVKIQSD